MQPTVQTVPVQNGMTGSKAKALLGIGIAVLVLGLTMVILDAVAISEANKLPLVISVTFFYSGVWGGVLYMIAGAMGILAGTHKRNTSLASGSIATSVIAAIGGFAAAIILAWAAIVCSIFLVVDGLATPTTTVCTSTIYILHSISTTVAFVNFIMVIILSAFSCSGGCGGSQNTSTVVVTTMPAVYANPSAQAYGQPSATAKMGYN